MLRERFLREDGIVKMAEMTLQLAFGVASRASQGGPLAAGGADLSGDFVAASGKRHGSLHLLGVIAHQVGRNDLAIELIGSTVTGNPQFPEAYSNLGNAQKAKGRRKGDRRLSPGDCLESGIRRCAQ